MKPLGADQGLTGPLDGAPVPVDLCRAIFERTQLGYAHCQAIYQDEETVDAVFKAVRRVDQMLATILDTAAARGSAGPDLEAFQRIGQVCLEARDALKALVPAAPERGAEARPAAVRGEAPKPCPVPGKVLLVDDDEDVRFLMARMLKKAGVLRVTTAAGGEEALASLAADLPDLVILDQNMPGMSGVQALGRIRERHPDLPVLFSSGQPDLQEWGALDQTRVAVIAKPFTLAEIQARLSEFEPTS
jgi:CheY-like chemotaxis protein